MFFGYDLPELKEKEKKITVVYTNVIHWDDEKIRLKESMIEWVKKREFLNLREFMSYYNTINPDFFQFF